MKEQIVAILRIVTPLAVGLVVFSEGLGISPRVVAAYFRERPGLMLRALLAPLVVVPAAALGLILALKPSPGLGVGLAILVACPPAPLMVSAATKRGASAAFMASLHLSLALLAFVTVPAVLYLLSIPLGFSADVDLGVMGWILARTILIPIGLGLTVRAFFPAFADRWGPALGKTGTAGVVLVLVVVLLALYPTLLNVDAWSYLVMAAVSMTALAIGHLAGPADPHEKTTLAIECGVRHPGLALTIAAANFGAERAIPVLVPCVLTFILIATVYMAVRRRSLGVAR